MRQKYKVYFEGAWDEIISERGFELFKDKGINLCGNSFSKKHHSFLEKKPYPDLIIATNPNMESVKFGFSKNIPVIFYTIFPDQIVGWDFKKNKYKLKISKNFKENIKLSRKILVNSHFSKNLITKTWGDFLKLKINLCYLGIDTESINKIRPNRKNDKIKVLWNHMWRKDKGFIEALEIILELACKHRNVDFLIGRKEDWDPRGDNGEQFYYNNFIKKIEKNLINNVFFIKSLKVDDYWKLLKSTDISFSSSLHETFGLSVLEQGAAKIACVLPKSESYPEIHKKALLVRNNKIKDSIEKMIKNKEERLKIALNCFENSQNYKIENFVNLLSKIIFKELKKI